MAALISPTNMTASNLPSPYVASASSEYDSGYAAWKAFSDPVTAAWATTSGTKTGWLKIDIGTAKIATRYIVKAHTSYYTYAPSDFTFEGSNNDSDWDTLDTQTDETFDAGTPTRTYDFSNSTAYRYYRLNVTDIEAATGELTVGELEIYETNSILTASGSSYSITGSAVTLTYSGSARTLTAATTSYAITGTAATLTYAQYGTGDVELPLLEIYAEGDEIPEGWASVSIPLIQVHATGYAGATAAVTIPLITLSATGYVEILGNADVELPLISVSGYGGGVADVTIPCLTVSATGYTGILGEADVRLPLISASGSAYTPIVGTASVTIPTIKVSATDTGDKTGTAEITIPRIRIASEGITGFVGTASLTLPVIEVDGEGYVNAVGTASLSLPVLILNAQGYVSSDTNYIVCLNVENFAISEYSNYNFDSFAEVDGVCLGCKDGSIYTLTGTTDNSTSISATMRTATTDFGTSLLKNMSDVYVGMDSTGGSATVRTVSEETLSSTETIIAPSEVGTSRAKTSLGTRARHWAVQISNYGSSSIEIVNVDMRALVQSRRVK